MVNDPEKIPVKKICEADWLRVYLQPIGFSFNIQS
jgi:hypothetical protein